MKSENPLNYLSTKSFRENSECDGVCEKCIKSEFCIFPNAPKLRTSGYRDSGDEAFNARLLDVFGFKTQYRYHGSRNPQEGHGFSNPYRDGSNTRSYSAGNYRKALGISNAAGFHGIYDGREGYSGMTPKGQKSNYFER